MSSNRPTLENAAPKEKSTRSQGGDNGISAEEHQRYRDLLDLEGRLREEVDDDFFEDPKSFRALHRVIDVLGAQLLDGHDHSSNGFGGSGRSDFETLHKNNPAYLAMRRQQEVVEDSIEHMAVNHCADLNSSVVAVGKVARQFNDAVSKVRSLRRQVRDVKDSLSLGQAGGAGGRGGVDGGANPNEPEESANRGRGAQASAKSLRELWLKKLECEAVLTLLKKLEVVRDAPNAFDALIHTRPCRIGAAVVLLSNALNTMFSEDVAQVTALHKILEQILSRKQRAEEIIWDTLHDVLYLRTGNSPIQEQSDSAAVESANAGKDSQGGAESKAGSSKDGNASGGRLHKRRSTRTVSSGDYDSEDSDAVYAVISDDDDDISVASGVSRSNRSIGPGDNAGGASVLQHAKQHTLRAGSSSYQPRRLLVSRAMIESELDLEADELRCLEDQTSVTPSSGSDPRHLQDLSSNLPRYTDPVLALRILVESLAKMGRLDDVERCLLENIEREIRRVAEREQARTYARIERRRGRLNKKNKRTSVAGTGEGSGMGGGASEHDDNTLREFRVHLSNLLSAFASVIARLSHLAQIVRYRICSDPSIATPSYRVKESALHSVLASADKLMQREIKGFLKACVDDSESAKGRSILAHLNGPSQERSNSTGRDVSSHERGIFSLGVINDASLKRGDSAQEAAANLAASRANILELPADQFVLSVLFPRSGGARPEVRHALTFRRAIARWTSDNTDLKRELAHSTGEAKSSPNHNTTSDETAIKFLDNVIERKLLPRLQDEAVNGTVHALERADAFEPILDGALYARATGAGHTDVEMCVACQALYASTGPLFSALHRLPKNREMYPQLVALLNHAILTFISRAKHRVGNVCFGKKAFHLLEVGHGGKERTAFSSAMESRKAYSNLLRLYGDTEHMEGGVAAGVEAVSRRGNYPPLPPSGDGKSKNSGRQNLAVGEGLMIDEEDAPLDKELEHISGLLNFANDHYGDDFDMCTDDELMKTACLAHSLLKVSGLLEQRLKSRRVGWEKTDKPTLELRENIKSIRFHGLRVAKFCRAEVLIQTVSRMSKIWMSSTLVATDAVRLPSCINDLGEYLTTASDNIREAGGNTIAAYSFSSLEEYIPLFLMQTVRIIADGYALHASLPLTLNGVEALDRSGSVLYRDLKSATSFENSFWDDEAAADAFERSASFVAMMEFDMEEVSYKNVKLLIVFLPELLRL
uniref:Exocyst complex component Sec8 n=2 Tax=Ditylum brightwellii TaxID=49249 RepID=A0A7S4S8A6_9STRA